MKEEKHEGHKKAEHMGKKHHMGKAHMKKEAGFGAKLGREKGKMSMDGPHK